MTARAPLGSDTFHAMVGIWYNQSWTDIAKGVPLWSDELVPAPPAHPSQRTVVVTAFLTGSKAGHTGSFMSHVSNLNKHIHRFIQRSPGLCNRTNVHVVHDSLSMRDNSTASGVSLHYFAPKRAMPPGDARWEMFSSVLHQLDWDCAWAIDLTDIDVLRLPPCTTRYYGEAGIAIGTDACGNIKPWMRETVAKANLTVTSPTFRAFLGMNHKRTGQPQHGRSLASLGHLSTQQPLNCGIVGGFRKALLPVIEQMSGRVNRWHSAVPPPPHVPMDMLFLNELFVDRAHVSGCTHRTPRRSIWHLASPTLTLWPHGALSPQPLPKGVPRDLCEPQTLRDPSTCRCGAASPTRPYCAPDISTPLLSVIERIASLPPAGSRGST